MADFYTLVMTLASFMLLLTTFNNPHLYSAYQYRLGLFPKEQSYAEFYDKYLESTKSETGFYKRKPDSGDEISHDEVLGIFYNLIKTNPAASIEFAMNIYKHSGRVYSFEKNKGDLARYVLKHFDLRGVVAQAAFGSVDLVDQTLWSGSILVTAFDGDPGCSSDLRAWIAAEFADKSYLPHLSMEVFRWKKKRDGETVYDCFKQYFSQRPDIYEAAKGVSW